MKFNLKKIIILGLMTVLTAIPLTVVQAETTTFSTKVPVLLTVINNKTLGSQTDGTTISIPTTKENVFYTNAESVTLSGVTTDRTKFNKIQLISSKNVIQDAQIALDGKWTVKNYMGTTTDYEQMTLRILDATGGVLDSTPLYFKMVDIIPGGTEPQGQTSNSNLAGTDYYLKQYTSGQAITVPDNVLQLIAGNPAIGVDDQPYNMYSSTVDSNTTTATKGYTKISAFTQGLSYDVTSENIMKNSNWLTYNIKVRPQSESLTGDYDIVYSMDTYTSEEGLAYQVTFSDNTYKSVTFKTHYNLASIEDYFKSTTYFQSNMTYANKNVNSLNTNYFFKGKITAKQWTTLYYSIKIPSLQEITNYCNTAYPGKTVKRVYWSFPARQSIMKANNTQMEAYSDGFNTTIPNTVYSSSATVTDFFSAYPMVYAMNDGTVIDPKTGLPQSGSKNNPAISWEYVSPQLTLHANSQYSMAKYPMVIKITDVTANDLNLYQLKAFNINNDGTNGTEITITEPNKAIDGRTIVFNGYMDLSTAQQIKFDLVKTDTMDLMSQSEMIKIRTDSSRPFFKITNENYLTVNSGAGVFIKYQISNYNSSDNYKLVFHDGSEVNLIGASGTALYEIKDPTVLDSINNGLKIDKFYAKYTFYADNYNEGEGTLSIFSDYNTISTTGRTIDMKVTNYPQYGVYASTTNFVLTLNVKYYEPSSVWGMPDKIYNPKDYLTFELFKVALDGTSDITIRRFTKAENMYQNSGMSDIVFTSQNEGWYAVQITIPNSTLLYGQNAYKIKVTDDFGASNIQRFGQYDQSETFIDPVSGGLSFVIDYLPEPFKRNYINYQQEHNSPSIPAGQVMDDFLTKYKLWIIVAVVVFILIFLFRGGLAVAGNSGVRGNYNIQRRSYGRFERNHMTKNQNFNHNMQREKYNDSYRMQKERHDSWGQWDNYKWTNRNNKNNNKQWKNKNWKKKY